MFPFGIAAENGLQGRERFLEAQEIQAAPDLEHPARALAAGGCRQTMVRESCEKSCRALLGEWD
jgi:hypothetical protein